MTDPDGLTIAWTDRHDAALLTIGAETIDGIYRGYRDGRVAWFRMHDPITAHPTAGQAIAAARAAYTAATSEQGRLPGMEATR